MKLLVDHNLSYKLAKLLKDEYPGSIAVQDVGLSQSPDIEVWNFARVNGFVVMTKDSDFIQ